MTQKFQAFGLFSLFFMLLNSGACGDYNCADCADDDDRPDWVNPGSIHNPGLVIHAIRVWETRHMIAFEELYERNYMDLCITTNSSVIPQVQYVRGDLITASGRIDKSFQMELWDTEELIGVYCQRLLINDDYAPDLARYRATIVDWDFNWNQRIMEIRFVPYD